MENWEKIFIERYPHASYQEAVKLIIQTLNEFGNDQVRLTCKDMSNMMNRKCFPGGRYFANIKAPFEKRQLTNCFALEVEDNRESWGQTLHDVCMYTLYGGGVGVDFSKCRENGASTSTPGQNAGGPCSLMRAIDAAVEQLRSCRRGALLAMLRWDHPDIEEFLHLKDKGKCQLNRTNISVKYDERWHDIIDFGPEHPEYSKAWNVFVMNVEMAVTGGEPGMLFNGRTHSPFGYLTNACGELRSFDSHDSCNIGGVFLSNCADSFEDVNQASETLVKLLLLGTRGSIVKSTQAAEIRKKNNRLLIGLGGLWPYREAYGLTQLGALMDSNSEHIRTFARETALALGMNVPVAVTGIAPHGSLSLFAEDLGGNSMPFAQAYLRKIQNGLQKPRIHVMIDKAWDRYRKLGINLRTEQELTLEERLDWQAFVQDHTDMGVSNTINIPARGDSGNEAPAEEIAAQILKHHRRLAGLTFYPSGAIANQPLTPIAAADADHYGGDGNVIEDNETLAELSKLLCKSGICGE